ncbi:MAG: 4'-phosphopantetheinyl transferase family protein [Bacteroidota bacterium]
MEYFLLIEHDHISKFEFEDLLAFSDPWCEKLSAIQRKKESLLARYLINEICKKQNLVSIYECGFKKDNKGRPYFVNQPDLFISITHCDGYVFVAVSNSAVGIDFEKIDLNSIEDLKIAFNDTDWKIVSNDVNSLFKYFSLKEAYSKMIGTGFTSEPADIQIESVEFNSHAIFFENNVSKFIFTVITSHFEPEQFLNLRFNFLS